jgi:NAD(P)-dependent dehydrogenase (short-subunit alcohol dehydrogenase family)
LLADEANVVFATCRDPAKAKSLQEVVKAAAFGRGHIVPLDVNKDESIDASAKEVTKVLDGKGLNYLLNNAGIVVRIPHPLHVKY